MAHTGFMAVGSATQEETVSRLIAAQARLQKQLQTYRANEVDSDQRKELDHELDEILARDRTGLRSNGKLVQGGDTNAFLYEAENLSIPELNQRIATVQMVTGRIELRTPGLRIERSQTREPETVLPAVGRSSSNISDRRDPTTSRLDEDELNEQAMQLLDPNNPDPQARALLSRYKQIVAQVTEQADSARYVATRLLSTPQQTGLTDQEQTQANLTLARVNRLQIIRPSALSSRVTSNGSFVGQAVLVRALKLESQGVHTLRDETALTTNSELEHLGMTERYKTAVQQMDVRAGEIAVAANARVLDRSSVREVPTGELQLGQGLSLPTPK